MNKGPVCPVLELGEAPVLQAFRGALVHCWDTEGVLSAAQQPWQRKTGGPPGRRAAPHSD